MGAPEQLKVVGSAATREIDALLATVAKGTGRKTVHALQVGARSHPAEHNWRHLVEGKVGKPVSVFYTGGAAGLDIAHRITRGEAVEISPAMGVVEQALFQVVLDHGDNRAMLAKQAGQRYPLSRDYRPTMFINVVARRPVGASPEP